MPYLAPEFEASSDIPATPDHRTGLAFPICANRTGGLCTASGEPNDTAIIMTALLSSSSENAWQQPTVSIEASAFDIEDPSGIASVNRKIDIVFAGFERENRYRLLRDTLEFRSDDNGGTTVYFKYHNLESDQIQDIEIGPGS